MKDWITAVKVFVLLRLQTLLTGLKSWLQLFS